MSNYLQDTGNLKDMPQSASRKRKLSDICEEDILPPAKRRRLMVELSKRFLQKVKEWHERRRKIILGLILYRDDLTRDVRRLARKRASSELYTEYEGLVKTKYRKMVEEVTTTTTTITTTTDSLAIVAANHTEAATSKVNLTEEVPRRRGLIKRLTDNAEIKQVPEVKVATAQNRNGWRRKGVKRF